MGISRARGVRTEGLVRVRALGIVGLLDGRLVCHYGDGCDASGGVGVVDGIAALGDVVGRGGVWIGVLSGCVCSHVCGICGMIMCKMSALVRLVAT
jgi:hypothetical protein